MKPSIILLSLVLALCGCTKSTSTEWEYEQPNWGKDFTSVVIQINTTTAAQPERVQCFSAGELLNAMGARRWELVTTADGPGGSFYYFKRHPGPVHEIYLFEEHSKPGGGAK